jgi:diguanylate cyclase (GGDEF)-like protein/PAS domain S-box-containing protein
LLIDGPIGVLLLDWADPSPADWAVRYANTAAVRQLGARSVADLVGRRFLDLVPVEARATLIRRLAGSRDGEAFDGQLVTGVRGLGQAGAPPRTLVVHAPPVATAGPGAQVLLAEVELDPHLHRIAAIVVDSASQRVPERAPQESAEQLRLSFDGAPVGMALLSLHRDYPGELLRANSALCDFLGCGERELFGCSLADLIHPDDLVGARAALASLASGRSPGWRAEIRFICREGQPRWGLISSAVLRRKGRPAYAVTHVEDITAHKEAEARLTRQALHDGLTGLANRLLLHDHLTHALARSGRTGTQVCVLYLDLDNFKTVNDSRGHTIGDQLLVEIGRRLTAALRGSDVAARVGGDEFVVVCEDLTSPDEIPPLAERLLEALREEVLLDGQRVAVAASVGIALGDARARADDLVRDADAAMYRAKTHGRARWEMADRQHHATARVEPGHLEASGDLDAPGHLEAPGDLEAQRDGVRSARRVDMLPHTP